MEQAELVKQAEVLQSADGGTRLFNAGHAALLGKQPVRPGVRPTSQMLRWRRADEYSTLWRGRLRELPTRAAISCPCSDTMCHGTHSIRCPVKHGGAEVCGRRARRYNGVEAGATARRSINYEKAVS